MNLEQLNSFDEAFVKRQRIVDICKVCKGYPSASQTDAISEVVEALQIGQADEHMYNECLNHAITSDFVPLVEAIVKIPRRSVEIPKEFFVRSESREIRALLVGYKECDSSTIITFARHVIDGKVEFDRDLLVDLIVKSAAEMSDSNTISVCQLMGRANMSSGIKRLFEASIFTRNWRQVAETNNRIGYDCSQEIFYHLLQTSSESSDTSMFELIYSMVRPYPDTCTRSMRGVKLIHINPRLFLNHYRHNWFTAEESAAQTKEFVDPKNRHLVETFLFQLATILYVEENSKLVTPINDGTARSDGIVCSDGRLLTTQMLTGASPAWMRDVKKRHDEMIEVLSALLPKDLVILSLAYLVGQ